MTLPMMDEPVAGYYAMRLSHREPGKGAVLVAVRLLYGQPPDPETGEPLDRSPRWMAWVDGEEHPDPHYVWIWSHHRPISEEDYHLMLAKAAWAREWKPEHPLANPRKPVDWNAVDPIRKDQVRE